MMKPNEGSADRAVRVFSGIAFLVVAALAGVTGGQIVGIVLAAVGAILVVTGALGFCPAYAIFGVRSCPLSRK